MKCLVLFSGGMDSILAVKLMQEQGIEVEAFNIKIGFELDGYDEKINRICRELGIGYTLVDESEHFLSKVLYKTLHGFEDYLDPCMDFKAHYINLAWDHARKIQADFLVTGDVLDQRSTGQSRDQLNDIDFKLAEVSRYLLRPLSARLLEPTIPEEKGWVDREKLPEIQGKNKKPQLALMEKYGFHNYLQMTGCFLSMDSFTKRLKIFHYKYALTRKNMPLLRTGRLFLANDKVLIISRNDQEKAFMNQYEDEHFIRINPGIEGSPVAFLDREATDEEIKYACRIILNYAKVPPGELTTINIAGKDYTEFPMSNEDVCHSMI